MITAEFQTKPAPVASPTVLKRRLQLDETPNEVAPAQPLSLLLNFSLHGRLADCDRAWLDSLAPAESICFLIHGERYLHPEDAPLFPLELIESSISPGGTSVFTQRFSPKDSPNLASHRIMSTVVGTVSEAPMRFGLFGRENQIPSHGLELAFSNSVAALREAAASISDLSERILSELQTSAPCCVLDRTTGRVISANTAFADLINDDASALSGRLFEDLATDYPRQFAVNGLVIQNVSIARWALSIVTVGENSVRVVEDDISRFFFHKIRNRLSCITTSASYLQSLESPTLDPDEASLITVIVDESCALEEELARFELVSQFPTLPVRHQLLVEELRRAQLNVAPEIEWTYDGSEIGQNATVAAPENALFRLFEAVFHFHSNNASRGTITFSRDTNPTRLRIEVTSNTDHETVRSSYWTTFMSQLCGLMGAEVNTNGKTRSHTSTVTLTLSISQDQS